MKSYFVGDKEYTTICSVHNEVLRILNKSIEQNSLKDIDLAVELIKVSSEMGQNMENSLKYKNSIGFGAINTNIYNMNSDEKE